MSNVKLKTFLSFTFTCAELPLIVYFQLCRKVSGRGHGEALKWFTNCLNRCAEDREEDGKTGKKTMKENLISVGLFKFIFFRSDDK